MTHRTGFRSLVIGVAVIVPVGATSGFSQWCVAHCGPAAGVKSVAACQQCCTAAGQSGAIEPEDVADCKQTCSQMDFKPSMPWLDRQLARVWGWFD